MNFQIFKHTPQGIEGEPQGTCEGCGLLIVCGIGILGLVYIFLRNPLSMLTTYRGLAMLLFAILAGVLTEWGR